MSDTNASEFQRIAVIGDYLPRKCGIATFTTDLCESMAAEFGDAICFAMPVNDTEDGYAYPPRVRFELVEDDVNSYRRAADFLNLNNVDLVCLQHEYGIFGGACGDYILELLRPLRMPVVATLHSILQSPSPKQRRVLQELAQLSDRLVVMTQRGREFLRDVYGVSTAKIDLIPHGIPDVPFVDPNFHKDKFGVEGKQVLLTFGLLSPNKGIENVIEALPAIVARHPDVVFIVLGATHPHVLAHDGESYRQSVQRLICARGVEPHVIWHNRFVSLKELNEFIGAADIYVTPYLNRDQIVSGTLAYAAGAGKAVISTPYWHAEELLAGERGALVPFNDPVALANRVLDLLDNEVERHAMRKRAYLYSRDSVWRRVAHRYIECFQRARAGRARAIDRGYVARSRTERRGEFPLLKLDHLRRLTDGLGIFQHAIFSVPNYAEGYCTDDNARALVLTVLLGELGDDDAVEAQVLATRYLAFLWSAFDPKPGRFRNFLSFDRRWLEEIGSEDCHGRALWGLGSVLARSENHGLRGMAGRLFELAVPAVSEFVSPRAWAFALVGIHEYLRRFAGDRAVQTIREQLAGRLMESHARVHAPDWEWFENELTYANAVLPQALIICGQGMDNGEMSAVGLRALDWLAKVQRVGDGHFVPIGSRGFYRHGGERARFDQQPIEAQAMVSACLAAFHFTSDPRWREEAQRAFDWFLGHNDLRLPLYDPRTGGCRDGLHSDRTNQNQGAESTLSFLLALLELRLAAVT